MAANPSTWIGNRLGRVVAISPKCSYHWRDGSQPQSPDLPKPQAISSACRTSAHRVSKIAQHRTDSAPLRQGDVIEVQRTGGWHPSLTVKTTSVVNPRIVRVAGATMISFR
jgi:hypothetical protein